MLFWYNFCFLELLKKAGNMNRISRILSVGPSTLVSLRLTVAAQQSSSCLAGTGPWFWPLTLHHWGRKKKMNTFVAYGHNFSWVYLDSRNNKLTGLRKALLVIWAWNTAVRFCLTAVCERNSSWFWHSDCLEVPLPWNRILLAAGDLSFSTNCTPLKAARVSINKTQTLIWKTVKKPGGVSDSMDAGGTAWSYTDAQGYTQTPTREGLFSNGAFCFRLPIPLIQKTNCIPFLWCLPKLTSSGWRITGPWTPHSFLADRTPDLILGMVQWSLLAVTASVPDCFQFAITDLDGLHFPSGTSNTLVKTSVLYSAAIPEKESFLGCSLNEPLRRKIGKQCKHI